MVFVRVKRIRGRDYAYLVASRWDPSRRTSRQIVVKYLGPIGDVRLDAVPERYRTARVRSFLLRHSRDRQERLSRQLASLQNRLRQVLLDGDREAAERICREARSALGLDRFYLDVVTPTMHAIGDQWRSRGITVSMEHLASNVMADIIQALNEEIRWSGRPRGTALLCTPQGEMHDMSSSVLEGLLTRRGYRCWNISASAPTESIASFVASRRPDVVLVSLTIREFLPSARRLVRAIRRRALMVPILVGGQGIRSADSPGLGPNVTFVEDGALAAIDGLVARPAT